MGMESYTVWPLCPMSVTRRDVSSVVVVQTNPWRLWGLDLECPPIRGCLVPHPRGPHVQGPDWQAPCRQWGPSG